ncbi:DUF89 domain-containing protein [Thermoproteota archaeon]
MKTYLDCIPCFFEMALQGSRIANTDEKTQKLILDQIAEVIPTLSLESTPPEMGRIINRIICKATHKNDAYYEIKQKSNKIALAIYHHLKMKVAHSKDRLLIAVKLAIAGNIIDYGVNADLDLDLELNKILKQEESMLEKEDKCFFDFTRFRSKIIKAIHILYLGDNAGEIVFDKLLIEEIKSANPKATITFAVRGKPVINDALIEDALFCGLDKLAKVISSGSDAPGTILSLCTDDFLKEFTIADLIISKGQGNFEGLSNVSDRPIFFLLIAKCPVIAKDIGCELGGVNLLYQK